MRTMRIVHNSRRSTTSPDDLDLSPFDLKSAWLVTNFTRTPCTPGPIDEEGLAAPSTTLPQLLGVATEGP